VHCLRSLLADRAILACNVTTTPNNPNAKTIITTRSMPLQAKTCALMGINPSGSR
jgi:hypothetical protein